MNESPLAPETISAPQAEIICFGPQKYLPTEDKYGEEHPQERFMSSSADIVIYGGARGGGKSYGLLLDAMRYTQTPGYGAVIFRRTMQDVMKEGGLWDTAGRIYPFAGATSSSGGWEFPTGSSISFGGLEHENSKISWLGTQIPYLGFDQLEEFSESQFWYMLGCNRSPCGVPACVRATANPVPGWLANLVAWWLDEKGEYPDMTKSGIIRWFVREKDRIFWADTREELLERFKHNPDLVPKSLTFIPAFVDDNKALLEADPTYKSNLYAQGDVEKERWLKGNWKVKMSAGMLLQRAWFNKVIEARPVKFDRLMRYWDFAATEETDKNKNPCYTAGALVGIVGGIWYIMDIQRVRSAPPEVEALVKSCAIGDPRLTEIRIEKEPGSQGKFTISHFQRNVLPGYNVSQGDETWNRQGKIERAKAIASAAKAGNVVLVRRPQDNGEWIENFLTDCDAAPDGWMDMIDSVSGAFGEMRTSMGGSLPRRVEIPEHAELKIASTRKRELW